MIQIIDDVLPQSYANEIESFVFQNLSFDWYMLEDITYTNTPQFAQLAEEDKTIGFTHSLLMEGQESRFFNIFKIIPHLATQKSGITNSFQYLKARCFLQLPSDGKHNNVHTDMPGPHLVCLYYINDSDGDTVLFDKDRKTVLQSVKPKKNRVVLFDGSIPHCSSSPTIGKRCVVNFNIMI